MNESLMASLLEDLKQADESIRERATQELWRLWFEQKGVMGFELLRQAQLLLDRYDLAGAESLLTDVVKHQPDFAEAWNRRAVLYYIQGNYHAAIADCETVIQLTPCHFGAWHGLGLCHMALENYDDARQAFQQALSIQPYSVENQRLILECTVHLS